MVLPDRLVPPTLTIVFPCSLSGLLIIPTVSPSSCGSIDNVFDLESAIEPMTGRVVHDLPRNKPNPWVDATTALIMVIGRSKFWPWHPPDFSLTRFAEHLTVNLDCLLGDNAGRPFTIKLVTSVAAHLASQRLVLEQQRYFVRQCLDVARRNKKSCAAIIDLRRESADRGRHDRLCKRIG